MKKYIFALVFLFLIATQLWAQRQPQRAPVSHAIEQFADQLALSESQKEQLQAIRSSTRIDMDALRQADLSETDRRAQAKAKLEAAKEKSLALLTVPQREKLTTLQEAAQLAYKAQLASRVSMRSELATYHEKEVSPVLKKARLKLEKSIAVADQQEIDRLRALFANRPKGQPASEQQKGGKFATAQRATQRAQQQEARKNWRSEHQADLEILQTLTQRNQKDIAAILSELAPEKEQWEKDKAAIRAKYIPANQQRPVARHSTTDRQPRDHGRENDPTATHGDRKYSRFLLLDPENIPAPAARNSGKSSASISVSPNPASGQASIQINVKEEGDVLLRLVSEDGRLVKQVGKLYLTPGNHTLPLALEGLVSGRYTLLLKDKTGRTATSVIVR